MADLFLSDPRLEAYLSQCMDSARHCQEAYESAIVAAPDESHKHQMVRFAEQSRMRVDVLTHLKHQYCPSPPALTGPEPDDPAFQWWAQLCHLWAAESQNAQHTTLLQAWVAAAPSDDAFGTAVADLAPAQDERLHVLQVLVCEGAAQLKGSPLPVA